MIRLPVGTLILSAGLALSLLANVFTIREVLSLREEVGQIRQERDSANRAALSCSRSVDDLRTKAQDQAQEAAKAVAAAQGRAKAAEARARTELSRPQAVPGDACASAEVETREWLLQRRAGQ